MQLERPCPCGLPATYDACCGRLHRGAAPAATAEELMRSRYAAYAVGGRVGADHLFRTWHPRTRPDDTTPDPGLTWTGLTVEATEAGGPEDTTGVVVFAARFVDATGQPGVLRERSRFARRAGRWVYVDGDVDA
ncbi:SEC-C motif-containing protein [Nocardioides zeae]|uniref:SEC-C motif-containing protein n=1 Tax=Nocardioides zeae TaxID=1457234 RepID=A0ACC6IDA7_9ACTN|nr:YchJ family metal-binding protein [Nocardioides zeae]MDR6175674.1 SEC-C motif-containing protein [Nocardioides zeae]MDR6208603.1 SEC-C motif-containing protein [Nocardioides zeae]